MHKKADADQNMLLTQDLLYPQSEIQKLMDQFLKTWTFFDALTLLPFIKLQIKEETSRH